MEKITAVPAAKSQKPWSDEDSSYLCFFWYKTVRGNKKKKGLTKGNMAKALGRSMGSCAARVNYLQGKGEEFKYFYMLYKDKYEKNSPLDTSFGYCAKEDSAINKYTLISLSDNEIRALRSMIKNNASCRFGCVYEEMKGLESKCSDCSFMKSVSNIKSKLDRSN